jgi:hypothetical protein
MKRRAPATLRYRDSIDSMSAFDGLAWALRDDALAVLSSPLVSV